MIRKAQWVIYCTIKIWIITRSVIKTLLELLWKESSGKKCYQNYFVRKTIDKLLLCFANYNFQCSFFLANLNEIAMSIASKYLFFRIIWEIKKQWNFLFITRFVGKLKPSFVIVSKTRIINLYKSVFGLMTLKQWRMSFAIAECMVNRKMQRF